MNMIIGKRQIVMASLVAALGLAVFVNWYYTGTEEKLTTGDEAVSESEMLAVPGAAEFVDSAVVSEEEYFAAAKLNRMTARDEAAETLQTVINTCDASSGAAVAAVQELSALNDAILQETELESKITAKIGGECIAYITDAAVEIVVNSELLNEESVLAINDIVHASCANVEDLRITGA